jgi:endogenous inhibitor of DNA gyrase (YacG/DUF329 family)
MVAEQQEQKVAAEAAGRCPICGKDARHDTRPFCSRRCADIDLARWLGGSYVIAGGSSDADEDGDDASAGAVPASVRREPSDGED